MKCVSPFVKAGRAYACGRCLPCSFRKRREWFSRIVLEASCHEANSVCTLTYDEAALPEDGELHPEHLRDWLKRFRARCVARYSWRRFRFYACGEYGEQSGRPHYHLVLFGIPGCEFGRGGRSWCGDCQCVSCSDVSETWGLGNCSLDAFTMASAGYISGYVSRKVILGQRGFTRMSRMPGIGANAMWDLASTLMQYRLDERELPTRLAQGTKSLMLGRYLRRRLNETLGRSPEELSSSVPAELERAMRCVFDVAYADGVSQKVLYAAINEVYASRLAQREAFKRGVL